MGTLNQVSNWTALISHSFRVWRVTIKMNSSATITVLLCLTSIANAGFRCKLGGNVACTTSCVALGQTSGVCDQEDDCNCSEKSITLSSLERLLPSRCNLGPKFCKATCESLGRQGGTCEDGNTECVCSDQFISPKEFALCAADSTCRLDCQRQGKATGQCFGWSCKCQSNRNDPIPAELTDLQ